ncbi:hypothetical protein [Paenibacillus tuaregi]|uniref:hypothetical protein n=1 Tax=Paenibacillus tuaregi TaxID=1816681 RepID=UPI000839482F|nr:hypothetical protein [Paenibacillus tuaregi]
MAQKPMYPAAVNSKQTELSAPIDATQTTIPVLDISVLPAAPNLLTVGTDETAETILYTGISGSNLTGVTRGFQGTAKAWTQGTKLARYFTAYDHDTVRDNLADLDTRVMAAQTKADGAETPTGAQAKADAAKTAAITAAATDATTKANTAESNAKAYSDTQAAIGNILPNSTGQLGLSGWIPNVAGKFSVANKGTNSPSFFIHGQPTTIAEYAQSDPIVVESGVQYSISADFFTFGATGGEIFLQVADNPVTTTLAKVTAQANSGWHSKSATFTVPSGVSSIVVRMYVSAGLPAVAKCFNRIMLNMGATPAPWNDVASNALLFTNVSNGKTAIASAITGKEVPASGSDTFAQLATKIGQISAGKKSASGSTNSGTVNRGSIDLGSTNYGSSYDLTVSGLSFTPSTVLAVRADGDRTQFTYRFLSSRGTLSEGIRVGGNAGQSQADIRSGGFTLRVLGINVPYEWMAIE